MENEGLLAHLCMLGNIHKYKKEQEIYKPGTRLSKFYILINGITYAYLEDCSCECVGGGKIITSYFVSEKDFLLNDGDFRKVASVGMKALTDVEIYTISLENALMLEKQYPELIWEYIRYLQKIIGFRCMIDNRRMYASAMDNYKWFCKNYPEVSKVASNKQIAAFLGVKPESLSRLKAQIREGKNTEKPVVDIFVTKDMQWNYQKLKRIMDNNESNKGKM